MRHAWLIAVIALGCGKKSEPTATGSASAAAGDAAVVAGRDPAGSGSAPASGSASAADAAVADDAGGPGDAAAGDAGADPRAAIPEEGILLATEAKDHLIIAKLDRTGVKIQHQLPASEVVTFAWLDSETLVVKEPFGKNDKPVVMKVVGGKPTETVELADVWETSTMLVTKGNEVWVERCTVEPEGADPCTKFAYLRVWPSQKPAKKKPKDLDPTRVSSSLFARGLYGPTPAVPAPKDIQVTIKKNVPKGDAGNAVVSVFCSKPGQDALYPSTRSEEAEYGFVAKSTRWVLADPPIFELVADETNPVGQVDHTVTYFKACNSTPLGGFIGLVGPLWGQYDDAKGIEGTWTFRVGTTEVGMLDGGPLRANR